MPTRCTSHCKKNAQVRLMRFLEHLRRFSRHPFAFLWRSPTLPGVIARREMLGFRLKRDAPLMEKLRRGIFNSQFPRGSWKGSVGWTAYQLSCLWHLNAPSDHPQIEKAIEFIEAHQTSDGNFYERLTIPGTYPSVDGGEFVTGPFSWGFTAYVLEGLWRWRPDAPSTRRAIQWLVDRYQADGICCLPCAIYVLSFLAKLESLPSEVICYEIIMWLSEQQRDDGIWHSDISATFLVLHGLGSTSSPEAHMQVKRAIPLLAALQYEDGGWGRMGRAEKSLTVARALQRHFLVEEFLAYLRSHPDAGRPVRLIRQLPTGLDRFAPMV